MRLAGRVLPTDRDLVADVRGGHRGVEIRHRRDALPVDRGDLGAGLTLASPASISCAIDSASSIGIANAVVLVSPVARADVGRYPLLDAAVVMPITCPYALTVAPPEAPAVGARPAGVRGCRFGEWFGLDRVEVVVRIFVRRFHAGLQSLDFEHGGRASGASWSSARTR